MSCHVISFSASSLHNKQKLSIQQMPLLCSTSVPLLRSKEKWLHKTFVCLIYHFSEGPEIALKCPQAARSVEKYSISVKALRKSASKLNSVKAITFGNTGTQQLLRADRKNIKTKAERGNTTRPKYRQGNAGDLCLLCQVKE